MGRRKTTDGGAAKKQANSLHAAPVEAARTRVWERHLRGVPKSRIAAEFGMARETVSKLISECYRETAAERRASLVRKQNAAIARMRRVQEQAWADHDADDERERSVLALMTGGDDSDESSKPRSMASHVVRYQSQRSQYLRAILDAEKEIARLEGLYEASGDDNGSVVFRVEVRDASGATVTSAANRGILAPRAADEEQEFELSDGGDNE